MPILLTIVSGVFGLGTVLLARPESWLLAVLCVPLGGSLGSALLALAVMGLRRWSPGQECGAVGAQGESIQLEA